MNSSFRFIALTAFVVNLALGRDVLLDKKQMGSFAKGFGEYTRTVNKYMWGWRAAWRALSKDNLY